jgi:dimeric dUTPase (all-alpha-NTP-PPase superfamily)
MNIHDVKEVVNDGRSIIEQIFHHQREVMVKYHEIEGKNGLLLDPKVPVDIHSHLGQARLKDFAWRVTEELMESAEALEDEDFVHAREEAADALHFITELCILSGMSHLDVSFDDGSAGNFVDEVHGVILYLGKAMNCLKNKPWKQSQMLTDVARYRKNLGYAFGGMHYVFASLKVDHDGMFDFYFRKNQVNKFRQRSQY